MITMKVIKCFSKILKVNLKKLTLNNMNTKLKFHESFKIINFGEI